VYQDVLDDSILRDLSSSHVGAILKLTKERKLGGLVSHHGRDCCHLSWLILLKEIFDFVLGHRFLGLQVLFVAISRRRR
jgi:hypothetical protein